MGRACHHVKFMRDRTLELVTCATVGCAQWMLVSVAVLNLDSLMGL
ncbi:hypothetical protein ACQ4M4_06905 [Leptolyngbya sp. AN02str]